MTSHKVKYDLVKIFREQNFFMARSLRGGFSVQRYIYGDKKSNSEACSVWQRCCEIQIAKCQTIDVLARKYIILAVIVIIYWNG